MRAAKLIAPGKIEVMEIPFEFETARDEVIIQIKAVGICGTDIHIFQGHRADVELPRVMGHELSGIILAVGEEVREIKPGDKVVLDPVFSCEHCPACEKGHGNVCAQVKCFGVQMDGGFQDYIKVPANRVHKMPENVTFEQAAVAEPFSIAANILDRTCAAKDDKIVVIGAGTIGLAIVQAISGMGGSVLVSDVVALKLHMAKEFGASCIVNSSKESLVECAEQFYPFGADIIIDAVGIAPLLEKSLELAAPSARIAVIGFDGSSASIPPVSITKKELVIIGSRMNQGKFPKVMQWLKDKTVDPQKMITGVYPLEDIQSAFEETIHNSHSCVKTIIKFDSYN